MGCLKSAVGSETSVSLYQTNVATSQKIAIFSRKLFEIKVVNLKVAHMLYHCVVYVRWSVCQNFRGVLFSRYANVEIGIIIRDTKVCGLYDTTASESIIHMVTRWLTHVVFEGL
jgi:hypothetical protein